MTKWVLHPTLMVEAVSKWQDASESLNVTQELVRRATMKKKLKNLERKPLCLLDEVEGSRRNATTSR